MNQEGLRKAKKYIDQNIFHNRRESDIPRSNTANLYSNKVMILNLIRKVLK